MKKFIIFLFLMSCSSNNAKESLSTNNFNFNDELSFEQYKKLLIEYNEISNYPDIDK